MQSHVFTCIHYSVVGTSGYCWMQVYHRYVLGLYRIFEARMNCDRGTALCWPVMAGDHFQLSPRPLRELCVCDLSENMDELNRFQMEVEQSSAWYIFDIIWHFESFWCIRSFVRFIVMFLHSAVGLERSGGGRFDAALLAWCPQVHNRNIQNSICGYLQPLYVDRWPLITLYMYIWLYVYIYIIIHDYIYVYILDSEVTCVCQRRCLPPAFFCSCLCSQAWCSDNSDAFSRTRIQMGTSMWVGMPATCATLKPSVTRSTQCHSGPSAMYGCPHRSMPNSQLSTWNSAGIDIGHDWKLLVS